MYPSCVMVKFSRLVSVIGPPMLLSSSVWHTHDGLCRELQRVCLL